MASFPSTISHLSPFRRSARCASGVALVIVLAFLVLLSGLIVAFFITTTTDVVSSRNYAQEATAKELADAAVNLATSQIKDATVGYASGVGTSGTLAWASQPGMIRTWDDTGNFYKAFKLYSSDQLVASGADFNPTADYTALSTWNTGAPTKAYNALYADLNSPIEDVAGTLHYPIMDPGGDTGTATTGTAVTSTGIEGFHITSPPGYSSGTAAGPGNNPAPMPIKWLYVLQDGTLAPPAPGAVSGTQINVGSTAANTPTTSNPIVGRVAFWTDDDTCKVNLNTASEGVYWDIPRTQTYDDHGGNDSSVVGLATSVPSSTEFQRVPGHPATTSLSTVLGYHFDPNRQRPEYFATGDPSGNYVKYLKPYYDLLPRVNPGGTNGGTYYNPNGSGPTIVGRRLFASVDELLFAPPTGNAVTPGQNLVARNTNGVDGGGTTAFTKADIEKVRFFLTTNSRAPDVNLYNKPRISLWPLMFDTASLSNALNATYPSAVRNAKDDLMAFCASVGVDPSKTQAGKLDPRTSKLPYYFQRFQPFIQQGQAPSAINYARPGSSQSPYDDLSQPAVKRNSQLLNYLHTLTNLNVPGLGGSLAAKYPLDNDQILTEAFDYVRSTVNTSSLNSTFAASNYNYSPNNSDGSPSGIGASSVVPIHTDPALGVYNSVKIPGTVTMGCGRWSIIAEVSILFWATEAKDVSTFGALQNGVQLPPTPGADNAHPNPDGLPDDEPVFVLTNGKNYVGPYSNNSSSTSPPPQIANPPQVVYRGAGMARTKSIEAAIIITPTTVSPGDPIFCPALRYEITGLNTFTVSWNGNQASLNLPADAFQTIQSETGLGFDGESNWFDQFTYDMGEYGQHYPVTQMTPTQIGTYSNGTLGGAIQRNPPPPAATLNPFVSSAPAQIGGYSGTLSSVNVTNYPPPLAYQPTWLPTNGVYGPDASGDALPAFDNMYVWAGDGATPSNPTAGVLQAGYIPKPYTMTFNGGNIQIKVYSGLYTQAAPAGSTSDTQAQPVQVYNLTFPPCTIPVPQIVRAAFGRGGFPVSGSNVDVQFAGALQSVGSSIGSPRDGNLDFYTGWTIPTASGPWNATPLYNAASNPYPWNTRFPQFPGGGYSNPNGPSPQNYTLYTTPEQLPAAIARTGDVVRSISLDSNGPTKGDYRLLAATYNVPSNYFAPLTYVNGTTGLSVTRYGALNTVHPYWQDMYWTTRTEGNINQRTPIGYLDNDQGTNFGDPCDSVTLNTHQVLYVPHLRMWPFRGLLESRGRLVQGVKYGDDSYHNAPPVISYGLNGAMLNGLNGAAPGDWDNGIGNFYDGAYINKADEGYGENGADNVYFPGNFHNTGGAGEGNAVSAYSPNRQVASAVALGSLPTGVISQKPWQTLLFCPNPAAGDAHPGFGTSSTGIGSSATPPYLTPPDHALLDLFYMPVVDPYAISEAFSTAGRINMNYQIQPFTNVERSTAVRAVLKGMKIQAVSASVANEPDFGPPNYYYKGTYEGQSVSPWGSRYDINVDATLTGFANRFGKSDIFHSASEVCNIFLVPQNPNPNIYPWTVPQQVEGDAPGSYAATRAWWSNYTITGDNSREAPYNQIYPRLTTKSNTYTVHMRVQMLKKLAGSTANTWDETKDQVLSEYRGSASIERYIDPNDPNLPDFATGIPATGGSALSSTDPRLNMDSYYRFRIVNTRQFQP